MQHANVGATANGVRQLLRRGSDLAEDAHFERHEVLLGLHFAHDTVLAVDVKDQLRSARLQLGISSRDAGLHALQKSVDLAAQDRIANAADEEAALADDGRAFELDLVDRCRPERAAAHAHRALVELLVAVWVWVWAQARCCCGGGAARAEVELAAHAGRKDGAPVAIL